MIEPTENDIGRKVVYERGNRPFEEGVITSFNEKYVFVRYAGDTHSKATPPADLAYFYVASKGA